MKPYLLIYIALTLILFTILYILTQALVQNITEALSQLPPGNYTTYSLYIPNTFKPPHPLLYL